MGGGTPFFYFSVGCGGETIFFLCWVGSFSIGGEGGGLK